jgi:hypothetical protein
MTFPWTVGVLAVVLALNRIAVPSVLHHPVAFWGIQALNAGLAVAVILFGVPGLEGFGAVAWLVAALLAFHVIQNVALRADTLGRARRDAAERDRIRKLRALEPQLRVDEPPPDRTDP